VKSGLLLDKNKAINHFSSGLAVEKFPFLNTNRQTLYSNVGQNEPKSGQIMLLLAI
jgi:hypothetical protein